MSSPIKEIAIEAAIEKNIAASAILEPPVDNILACDRCPLSSQCKGPVPSLGHVLSKYAVFGRNPGETEDTTKIPFTSGTPGGRILRDYLEVFGVPRESIYSWVFVMNLISCYTKGNAVPDLLCQQRCAIWRYQELQQFSKLKIIFLMGQYVTTCVTGNSTSPVKLVADRTVFIQLLFGQPVILVPCLHPGFVCRRGSVKKDMIEFLTLVKEKYE